MPDYAEIVRYLVTAMVDRPEAVQVTADGEDDRVRVLVQVAPEDVGTVIGRHGRHIEAIRMVVRSAAIRANQRVQVEIAE